MKKITLFIALFVCFTYNSFAQNRFFKNIESQVSNGKNSILVFFKPDCPHCIQLRNDIDSSVPFLTALQKKYSIQLVDVITDAGQKEALKYHVRSVPFIISYNSGNVQQRQIKGYSSLNGLAVSLGLDFTNTATYRNSSGICGNGIVEDGEACDDANAVNGDGCENNCTLTPVTFICGNGIVEEGEACDDANAVNGDGCENNCTLTPLSIDNPSELGNNIAIAPMPFIDSFTVKLTTNQQSDFSVSIYNVRGQAVKSQMTLTAGVGNAALYVNGLESLPSGIYLLKIESKNGSYSTVRKIVKQ